MYIVYWRDKSRNVHHGFVKARTHDEAYDFTMKKLKECTATAVYRATESGITANDICINFTPDRA